MKTLLTVFLTAVALQATAAEGYTYFNYASDDPTSNSLWGTNKQEGYDVAMRLNNPSLVGKSISRITIPVVDSDAIGGYSVWLSSELKLESKVNVPDIASYDCSPSGGFLTVELPEAVVIPADGLYVGYSFTMSTLDDASRYPVTVTDFTNRPGSFYIHSSRTYKQWKDVAQTLYMSPFIRVRLTGDFPSDALEVINVAETNVQAGSSSNIQLNVRNAGGNPVSSLEYVVTLTDGKRVDEGTLELPSTLEPSVLNTSVVEIPVTESAIGSLDIGSYAVDVKITEVNGQSNYAQNSSLSGDFHILPFIPVHKPVLEEYTGLWCGYCPRGFVGLEIMNHLYPDDFIGVSYHGGDVMEVVPNDGFPSEIDGFPDAWIDRSEHTDAYSGRNGGGNFGVDVVWEAARRKIAPADISVEAGFIDEAQTVIYVGAYNHFAKKNGDSYRQVFMLTADGLTDEKWFQANNYSKDTSYDNSPWRDYWTPFVEGGGNVRGLVYNDVLVAYTDLKGVGFDVSPDYKVGQTIKMTHHFKIADILNLDGDPVIQDNSKLSAVVLLVNAETGVIENANKVPVNLDPSAVHAINSDKEIREISYFDLSGRRVEKTAEGIILKRIVYTDGIVKTEKIVNLKR